MIVFLNGRFVTEVRARVSIFDRGFLYGDGLFETVLVRNGRPFRLGQHLARLQRGAGMLKILLPQPPRQLESIAADLIQQNAMSEAVLRVHLSRGRGPRGYSIKGTGSPTLVMSLHPAPQIDLAHPPCWRLITSLLRVPLNDPLACLKTSNKLPSVLARIEAEELGANDALLLNTSGKLAGTAGANLFWILKGNVRTPSLQGGALDGITRAIIFELCRKKRLSCGEQEILPSRLGEADGIFLTLSTLGIVEVAALDGKKLKRSPLVTRLRDFYWNLVEDETGGRSS